MIEQDFPLNKYPTLLDFAKSEAKIRCVIGPAGCLSADTEVLTRTGWVKMSDATTDNILVYNPETNKAYFDDVEHLAYPCPEGLHRFKTSYALDMVVSDEHRVWYTTQYDKDTWRVARGGELAKQWLSGSTRTARVKTTFEVDGGEAYPLTDEQLRICVMLSADGHLPKKGSRAFVTVRKERKKERVRYLLDKAGIEYKETTYQSRPTETIFTFEPPEWNKDLSRFFNVPTEQLKIIADECLYWDASVGEHGSYYSSSEKSNADFIQFAFVATGTPSIITTTTYPDKPTWRDSYRVTFSVSQKTAWANMKTAKYSHVKAPDGKKYCFHTNTGMFVARHNGKIFVTGNSAKTSFMAMEVFRRACEQAPAPQPDTDGKYVRYSRVLVGRNTYQILKSATLPTFKNMLGQWCSFKDGSAPIRGFIRVELEDGTRVSCDIEFISFDSPDSIGKLLGYEPTMVFLDEVSELPEEVVLAAARRIGRYPSGRFGTCSWSGVFMATNGPRKNHWLYQWYLGKKDAEFSVAEKGSGRKQFALFMQPPALIKNIHGEWVPNPRAENIDNLADGYGYYFDKLADSKQDIQAYVEGKFADLVTGTLVFPEFNRDIHVVPSADYPMRNQSFRLYLSFDFGRTPFALLATSLPNGTLLIIDEVMGDTMSIETLVLEHLKPLIHKKYPYAIIEDAWGDPAGEVRGQATEMSPYEVLRTNGIPVRNPDPSNRLEPRLEAVRQSLKRLSSGGKPQLLITDNCTVTIQSLGSDYIYELKRGYNGQVHDKPTKSHENWVSEAADAVQYLTLGFNTVVGTRKLKRKYKNLPKLNRGII